MVDSKDTTVYLIRHAEADGNFYGRVHGRYNGLLTARGKLQVERLARRFRRVHIDAVYASELSRTQMTASAVTETKGLKMNICPGLNELDFGDWEDCTWGDIEVHHPKEYEIYSSRLWEFRAPGGESQSEASERLENALHQIARKHRGETVAVVSHGIAMRGFISKLRFGDYNHVYEVPHCDNTGVTKLIFQEDGSVTVDYYGDNSHLDKLTSRELSGEFNSTAYHLWFENLDIQKEQAYYLSCRSDAWRHIHGSMDHYDPSVFLSDAQKCVAQNPSGLMKVMYGTNPIGVLQCDFDFPDGESLHLPFVYLSAQWRGKRLGTQLIGQAQSLGRAFHKKQLRLRCAESNHSAQKFYSRLGFQVSDYENAKVCRMLIMTKSIIEERI